MEDFSLHSDEDLYKHIMQDNVKENILKKHKLGLDKFKLDNLVSEVRTRCEKNLWFLGKYFLWDTDVYGAGKPIEENFFTEDVHRRVADMFIVKDKTKTIGKQDPDFKDRIILYPRGTGKSAWDRYDTVQWVLNFPDIRILYLTATQPLAEGFVGETKGHFIISKESPSLMNVFFPEYCFSENYGNSLELVCPCAIWVKKGLTRKEPTVMSGSIETNLSGCHFEVMKADDAVSDENSNNEDRCKSISKAHALKHKMLVPTGYSDMIGTRYADEDMYGEYLKHNVGINIKKQSGTNWDIVVNSDLGLKVLIGRSIVIKPETIHKLEKENRPITYQEAGAEGCTLLFPEIHPFSWCMLEYSKNEIIFEGQQNQNPRSTVNPVFDKVLMMRHTVPFNDKVVPQIGPISQFWDFAFSTKKGRDYSTGSTVIWNAQRQCIVIDLIRSKFKPLDLAKAVVSNAVKYKPFIIGIEDAGGSKLLHEAIKIEAQKTKISEIIDVCNRIDWVSPSNQIDAKKTRIRALHPWIASDMMYFVSNLPYLEVMYEEFERCLLSGRHHDDIPDNLSYQVNYAPRMLQILQNQELENFSRADGGWQYMFDTSGELYGSWGAQYMPSPFKGYLLRQDMSEDGTIHINWVSEEIANPIIMIQPEVEFHSEVPSDGLDNILGSGLFG